MNRETEVLQQRLNATEEWARSRALNDQNAHYSFDLEAIDVNRLPDYDGGPMQAYSVKQYYDLTANIPHFADGKLAHVGKTWISWPQRRQHKRRVFRPGEPLFTKDNCLNLYRGMAAQPSKDDPTPFLELCELLAPDAAQRNFLLDTISHLIQHPGVKMAFAIVCCTVVQGVGKTTLADTLEAILGAWNISRVDEARLASQYSECVVNKLVVVGEEIAGAKKSRELAAKLKNLITERLVPVEPKYKPAKEADNHAFFLLLTNHEDSLYITDQDRRYFVLVSRAEPRPQSWYDHYHKWLRGDGAGIVLGYLLARDIAAFNPNARPPRTEGHALMVANSRSQVESWVAALREDPESVTMADAAPFRRVPTFATSGELLKLFGEHRGFSERAMGLALREAGFKPTSAAQTRLPSNKAVRLWVLRDSDRNCTLTEKAVRDIYLRDLGMSPAPKWARSRNLRIMGGAK
jgi:hypothetical protein